MAKDITGKLTNYIKTFLTVKIAQAKFMDTSFINTGIDFQNIFQIYSQLKYAEVNFIYHVLVYQYHYFLDNNNNNSADSIFFFYPIDPFI